MAEQVSATVLKIGTAPLLLTPQDWSFPTKAIAMEEVVDGDINTAISFLGTTYYVSETLSDLQTAANASTGGSSYLVYSGNLSQTGTSIPTCTPNQNTLTGDITFAYSSQGVFSLESSLNDFPDAAKVEIFYPSVLEPLGSFVIIARQSSSSIDIKTYEAQGDGTYLPANGYLTNWPFEIRVYP